MIVEVTTGNAKRHKHWIAFHFIGGDWHADTFLHETRWQPHGHLDWMPRPVLFQIRR